MPDHHTVGQAVPLWFLRAILLASAITIGLSMSEVVGDRLQSVMVWLTATVAFVMLQAVGWSWRTFTRRRSSQ